MDKNDFRSEREWFKGLAREGWRMELLISGFSLILLMKAPGNISYWQDYIELHLHFPGGMETLLNGFLSIFSLASKVLIVNLLINIFLRGFWIGTIGLNSIQDRIRVEDLGYTKRFTDYLNEKVMPLDRLTQRLDEICSVIFSFTFLIVFMLISFFLYILIGTVFNYLMLRLSEATTGVIQIILSSIGSISVIIIILCGVIYMIDTLTLGFLKRVRLISGVYFQVYKVISKLTFAPIYRSIYYSLITSFSHRQVFLFLVPYLVFLMGYSFWKYDQYNFFPSQIDHTQWQTNIYDDQRPQNEFIQKASIPSAWTQEDYLPVFIRYDVIHNADISEYCGVELESSLFTLETQNSFLSTDSIKQLQPENQSSAMGCLLKYYQVHLDKQPIFSDSLRLEHPSVFWYEHPINEERGLRIILDIDTLSRGQHWIRVDRPVRGVSGDWPREVYVEFPFWKE